MTHSRNVEALSASSWRAAGVRHAVMLRVLPALRHDLAAPMSVVRLTASVLQRKLAEAQPDADYCSARVAVLDQQIDAMSQTLRRLMDWDVSDAAGKASCVTRTRLVADCVDLLQPLWTLEDVKIELGPQPQRGSSAAETAWPNQRALRYLLLACLCHVHDAGAAACIRITPDRHDALLLQRVDQGAGSTRTVGQISHAIEPAQEPVRIDAAALACLAADLGYLVRFNRDGVWLQLARRSNGGTAAGSPGVSIEGDEGRGSDGGAGAALRPHGLTPKSRTANLA